MLEKYSLLVLWCNLPQKKKKKKSVVQKHNTMHLYCSKHVTHLRNIKIRVPCSYLCKIYVSLGLKIQCHFFKVKDFYTKTMCKSNMKVNYNAVMKQSSGFLLCVSQTCQTGILSCLSWYLTLMLVCLQSCDAQEKISPSLMRTCPFQCI